MKRRIAFTFTLAASAMLVFGVLPASAGTPPVNGVGKVGTCATTGQIKLKPGLVNGGTAPVAISVKTKPPKVFVPPCPGATGDGLNVISAQAKGGGTGTTNDCGSIVGTQPSNLTLTVKWKVAKGTAKLADSVISITSQTGGVSSTPPNHGQFDVSGSVTSGSFNGDAVTAHIVTDQDLNEIVAACGGKGLKKITFGQKASKDDGQIGSGSTTIG